MTMTGSMDVMDRTGHTKVLWDSSNADETRAARETFAAMKAQGYTAFKLKRKSGEQGGRLDEFDPSVEAMILVPQRAGG